DGMRAVGSGPREIDIRFQVTVDRRQRWSGETVLAPEGNFSGDGKVRDPDELDVERMVRVGASPCQDESTIWRATPGVYKRNCRTPERELGQDVFVAVVQPIAAGHDIEVVVSIGAGPGQRRRGRVGRCHRWPVAAGIVQNDFGSLGWPTKRDSRRGLG